MSAVPATQFVQLEAPAASGHWDVFGNALPLPSDKGGELNVTVGSDPAYLEFDRAAGVLEEAFARAKLAA